MTQRTSRVVALATLGFGIACAPMARVVGPAPARAWPGVLAHAQHSAARGEFDTADSTLATFAIRYPTSDEALETSYWRAVYALDPSNRAESVSGAISHLDSYLAATRPREHVLEATTLRRVAGQLDALNRLAAGAIAQAKDANAAAAIARARDAAVAILTNDAKLERSEHAGLRRVLADRYARSLELFRVG